MPCCGISLPDAYGNVVQARIPVTSLPLRYKDDILDYSARYFVTSILNRIYIFREKEISLTQQVDRVAFMSYAHENDTYDQGYLSKFRQRLEAAVSSLIGGPFTIFQDHVHIKTGEEWERRLQQYLSTSTFLIPIITPHYYNSEWCRKEFMYFHEKEQQTQRSPCVFPVYYIECQQVKNRLRFSPDSMEHLLPRYQLKDWRKLRDSKIQSAAVTKNLRQLAHEIAHTLARFESDELPSGAMPPLAAPSDPLPASRRSTAASDRPPFDLFMLPYPSRFYGRSSEIAWVIERLTTGPRPHIASLDAAQGIGKSTVAAEAVRRLHEHAQFPGGIAVVLCHGITDPVTILRQALTRFHPQRLPPTSYDVTDLADEARHLLSGKRALIVLDDVDAHLHITRVIDPLRKAGAALLLTSQYPLILPDAARLALASLQPSDAFDLLTKPSEKRRSPDAECD